MSGSNTKKSDNGSASKGQATSSSQQGKGTAAKEIPVAAAAAAAATAQEEQTVTTQEDQATATQESQATSTEEEQTVATMRSTRPWNLIYSEPIIFTDIIKRYGVQGVVVNDVLLLSQLSELPLETTYAIILAYQYKESQSQETPEENDEDAAKIIFSNQVVVNSCATQSLVNTLTNVDIERGQLIQSFMDATENMSSVDRGLTLGDITQFREIHNSYGEPIPEQEDVEEEEEGKEQETENIYHFVTYLPKNGFLWELDSLELQPTKIMAINEGQNWLELLEPFLITKIANGELEANILAVVKDPLAEKEEQLAIMAAHDENLDSNLSKEMLNTEEATTSTDSNLAPLGQQIQKEQQELREKMETLQNEIDALKKEEADASTKLEGYKQETLDAIADLEETAAKSETGSKQPTKTLKGKGKEKATPLGPRTEKTITKAKEGKQATQRGKGRGRGARGRGKGRGKSQTPKSETPKASTSSTGKTGKTSKKRSFDDVEAEAARKEAVNKRYNLRRK